MNAGSLDDIRLDILNDTDFANSITGVYLFRPATPVPEPSTLLLLGTGLAAVGVRRYRRKGTPS